MKFISLIIIGLILMDCSRKTEFSKDELISIDTIYATNPTNDLNHKKPIIKLRSGSVNSSTFHLNLNEENLVKISLENYPAYPIYLKNLKNIALGRSEPNKGIFYLKPIDNVAQFDIYVDFGKGNAILKYEDNGYKYKPYEGLRLVARIKENIKISN